MTKLIRHSATTKLDTFEKRLKKSFPQINKKLKTTKKLPFSFLKNSENKRSLEKRGAALKETKDNRPKSEGGRRASGWGLGE